MLGVGRAKKKEEAPEVHGRVTVDGDGCFGFGFGKIWKTKKKQHIQQGSKKVGKE